MIITPCLHAHNRLIILITQHTLNLLLSKQLMHHTVVVYDLEYLEETLFQFSKIQTSFIDGFEAKLNVSITALQEFIPWTCN